MTREQIELLCRNIQASTGDWKPEESILLKHDTEQRQIIDEQVEENCGLRRDVRLMQKVNADQRAEIERLQAQLATAKRELEHWTHDSFKRREAALREALQGILDIGKRDMSNPKYDGYFAAAREALKEAS